MDIFQRCYDFTDADLVRQIGLYPYFQALSGSDGPVVELEGRQVVMMGSNNYLGLTHHPQVIAAAKEAIDRFGTGCTGSRALNGNLTIHDELEAELARFFRKESALIFSSGFLANTGAIGCLADDPEVVIFSDRENHASIIEGTRMARAKIRLFDGTADLAEQLSERKDWPHALVITEGIFSMTGRIGDLRGVVELKRRYGFRLYFDDAHGIGVLGPNGRGTAAEQGVEDDVDLLFGTFSKSLASMGGFIAGDAKVIDYLRHKARTQIFTAGLSASSAAAALTALRVMQREPDLLTQNRENVAFFRDGLEQLGFYTMGSTTPILPIFVGSESLAIRICKELLDMDVFTTPVVHPAVPFGHALLRTSTTPAHTRTHLQKVLDALAVIKQRYDIPEVDEDHLPVREEMDFTYFFTGGPSDEIEKHVGNP